MDVAATEKLQSKAETMNNTQKKNIQIIYQSGVMYGASLLLSGDVLCVNDEFI